MADRTYEVFTDLNPQELTTIAVETYRKWLEFALGKGQIGGKTLANPSGRYAAALSWKRTGIASVAIIADETVAPEAGWIEEGRAAADMKAAMLGKGKTKISKAGYMYRVIPMRRTPDAPTLGAEAISAASAKGSIKGKIKKVWAKPRSRIDSDRFVTMSNKPGSAAWRIPAFAPYAPGKILADLIGRSSTLMGAGN